jgi:hypothetical protein
MMRTGNSIRSLASSIRGKGARTPLRYWSEHQGDPNRRARDSGKSTAMVTTCQQSAQRLPLNLSPTGAQENAFCKSEGTCHGIINHTSDVECHANIIGVRTRTHGHEYC